MINVLILSKDPSLFDTGELSYAGDTRKRHIFYASRLRERYPNSQIRIITYTSYKFEKKIDQPCTGLHLYGTHSLHRATYIFGLIQKLWAIFADGWRPDIVSVQTPWEEGVIGCILARLVGARFVPQLHFDLFSSQWAAEHWLNPWRRIVAKNILRSGNCVRVVSTLLRDKVIAQCGIHPDRVCVVPVGVNFNAAIGEKHQFKHRLKPGLEKYKVVLFVGHLYSPKNLALWVAVAKLVIEREPKTMFVIVGDGPDKHMLIKLVESEELADRFLLTGRLGHEDLPSIYAAADIFLLTSHYEGFGRVVLEAFLSGIPVVSTNCIGPADLINDGCSGYLLPTGNAVGLAERVIELLEDGERAKVMGIAGRKQVKDKFSLAVLTDRMIDLWVTA